MHIAGGVKKELTRIPWGQRTYRKKIQEGAGNTTEDRRINTNDIDSDTVSTRNGPIATRNLYY